MRYNTNMNFTSSNDRNRNNVKAWLREFDRVCRHITSRAGLADDEYCHNLIAACPKGELAGMKLRRIQERDKSYRDLEAEGKYADCKEILLNCLLSLQRQRTVVAMDVRSKWKALKFNKGDNILKYHSNWEELRCDIEDNNLQDSEENVFLDYQEKFGDKDALSLVLFTDKPDTVEDLMNGLEEYYIHREALAATSHNAAGWRQRYQTQGRQWGDARQALGSLGRPRGRQARQKSKGKGPRSKSKSRSSSKVRGGGPSKAKQPCFAFAKTFNCAKGASC